MHSPAQSGKQDHDFVALSCEKAGETYSDKNFLVSSGDLSGEARRAKTEAGTMRGVLCASTSLRENIAFTI